MLRIANWNRNFETHDSRKLKRLGWVSLPNDLIDINYRALIDHPEGCSHFAAWVAIVQIASTCKMRGTLAESGVALTPRHFALKSGMPQSVFEAAIPRLISIGWLEEIAATPGDFPATPGDFPATPGDFPGTPGDSPATPGDFPAYITETLHNITEQDTKSVRPHPNAVEDFDYETAFSELWNAYPSKGRVRRIEAQQAFVDVCRSAEAFQSILEALKGKWSHSEKWAKGYIMALPSWLRQECWKEDPEPAAAESQNQYQRAE